MVQKLSSHHVANKSTRVVADLKVVHGSGRLASPESTLTSASADDFNVRNSIAIGQPAPAGFGSAGNLRGSDRAEVLAAELGEQLSAAAALRAAQSAPTPEASEAPSVLPSNPE